MMLVTVILGPDMGSQEAPNGVIMVVLCADMRSGVIRCVVMHAPLLLL